MRFLIMACACLFHFSGFSQLTNKDIVDMVASGLSAGIIKANIARAKSAYDLAPAALIELKKAHVPDDIVLCMLSKASPPESATAKDSLALLTAGIYYEVKAGYKAIEPSLLLTLNSKGIGGVLKKTMGGLINFPVKGEVTGEVAVMRLTGARPAFVFVLDFPLRGAGDLMLVRLKPTEGSRGISFQRAANGQDPILVADSLKIGFDAVRLRDKIYRLMIRAPLRLGEYAFMYAPTYLNAGTSIKIFDFDYQP